MTLKQAFTIWACAPSNIVLAAKSRDAVQRVLMKKWNDIDVEQFSETFCRRIFYQSMESAELKVKAASILVHVLQWGADSGHCKRPKFTAAIALEEHRRAQKDRGEPIEEVPRPYRITAPTLAEVKTGAADAGRQADEPVVKVKPEALARRMKELKDRNKPIKKTMEEKKTRGKQPRKICQIDAKTLCVVKVYDSCVEGCRQAGVKNIDRAIKKLQKAGGYYWQYPEDMPTFNERLKQKQEAQTAPKHDKGLVDKFNEEQQMYEQEKRKKVITKPKFKIGDHVFVKYDKNLSGMTGYVKAVDAELKIYDVFMDNDVIHRIDEKNIELVDEFKYQVKQTFHPTVVEILRDAPNEPPEHPKPSED